MEVDYHEYVNDVNEIDAATKQILKSLKWSCSHMPGSKRVELGQLLWEQAKKHFVEQGGASPAPVRLEGTRNRSRNTESAWQKVLPDLYNRNVKGAVFGGCHATLYETAESLRQAHQARAVDSHVTVGVELVSSNPCLWQGKWGTQIHFDWFIEWNRVGSPISKAYMVKSRLIVEKNVPLDPAEEALLEGIGEEDSAATDDVSSRAPTGSSGLGGNLSSTNTLPTATETISGGESASTRPDDGSTLAASGNGGSASHIQEKMSLSKILE